MKNIFAILVIYSFWFVSSLALASGSEQPKFEFGTVACSKENNLAECEIQFENTYDEPPLVFVMSSIDSSLTRFLDKDGNVVDPHSAGNYYKKVKSAETEYPSDLRVWSVDKKSSVIRQVIAPHAKACKRLSYGKRDREKEYKWRCRSEGQYQIPVKYVNAPMTSIDYLVIEPGEISFTSGAKISAGYVDADLTTSKANNRLDLHKQKVFYKSRFSTGAEPGVLVQVQTRNNNQHENNQIAEAQDAPLWLTAIAFKPDDDSFDLIIDRSEITPNRSNDRLRYKEKVAYVAGLGEGYYDRRKFWLGQGQTVPTLDTSDDNLIRPILDGCDSENAKTFFNQGVTFTKAPVFLASKKLRKGDNGGWLRRCSVERDGVYLINEEDMNSDSERGHVLEEFSYFLFEKPPVDGVCELFPSPAQTWSGNTSALLQMSNSAKIIGAQLSNGRRYVGFSPNSIHITNEEKNKSCDDGICLGDSGLMVTKQELETFREPSVDNHLKEVNVWNDSREFSNNEVIGTLRVGKGSVIFKTGTYWVGNIDINNGGVISVPAGEKVTIHVKRLSMSGKDKSKGNGHNHKSWFKEEKTSTKSGELIVLVHYDKDDKKASGVTFSEDSEFIGLLYSESSVQIDNNSIVRGAITARQIYMTGDAQIIATDNHCFTPSDNYKVILSPATQYALTCGTERPQFEIQTQNDGHAESTKVTVQVYPDADKFTVGVVESTGTGSYPNFTTSSVPSKLGKLKLRIAVADQNGIELDKEYTVKVTVNNDSSKTQTSTFKFVPFKFDVGDQTIVAGQNYPIETRVLACSDGQQTVVKSYTGSPSIQLELKAPNGGRSDQNLLTYAPEFTSSEQGTSSDEIFSLMESGLYTIKLEDENFTCDPNYSDNCPIAVDGGTQASTVVLNGSFSVKSRPWKIAVCDIAAISDGKANPATHDLGDGFIPAGERFNVTYKPIVHSDSQDSEKNVCDYPLTQNYFSDGSTTAPLGVDFSVSYPTGGDIANLAVSNDSELEFSKDEAKAGKSVPYVWDEVGSLSLKTSATYLVDMLLNEDSAVIGRFYPDYFQISDQKVWAYPDNQNDSVYMEQPFTHVQFSVSAFSATSKLTNNYGLFDDSLKVNFELTGDHAKRLNIDSDKELLKSSWKDAKWHKLWVDSIEWSKASKPDGPFNSSDDKKSVVTQLALALKEGHDPSSFKYEITDQKTQSATFVRSDSQILPSQPNVRYGRMNLSDVSGQVGAKLTVPLKVEYWDGERFVTNSHHSTTPVMNKLEKTPTYIWPNDGSDCEILLKGSGTLSGGIMRDFIAEQDSNSCDSLVRQQSQIRLDLDSTGNNLPWLKYNWDNKNTGEENPSSVVTFGIHRGNDRVIYRGEPGLTGQ
ncbi:MSHA biogenesis protein MshQ [Vibrio parahaemolyticus]|uniref:DUF6701 domain-containing protein n=1 Tax=Vibrio parahaemolyticus TaxID=670 RepID=UPI0005F0DDDD|nr:DUF6701 domain-containing protein [Vibrio parahaemolyticus]MBM5068396.1 MSHA biogenesis protein MshQ [Vibrio parahaemolyticus]MDG3393574.1 MSHA biogenesis protein MshQ [Vibrio parahaemolyticus]MDG3404111.1 MSHA biogenesis protein MshQ [Vibrio parahaemolyticus]